MPECTFFHALCQVHLRLEKKKITKGLNSLEMINCLKADNACCLFFVSPITGIWRSSMNREKVVKKTICSVGYAKAVLKRRLLKAPLTNQEERKAASCSYSNLLVPARKCAGAAVDISWVLLSKL